MQHWGVGLPSPPPQMPGPGPGKQLRKRGASRAGFLGY